MLRAPSSTWPLATWLGLLTLVAWSRLPHTTDLKLPGPNYAVIAACLSAEDNDQGLCRTSAAAKSFYKSLWGCHFEERGIYDVFSEYRMAEVFVDGKPMVGQNPYDHFYNESHRDIDVSDRQVVVCNGDDRWTFFMIGPDQTTGGEAWFEFQGRFKVAKDLQELAPTLRTHPDTPGWYAFDGFFIGSIDAGMTQILGYPPLHIHHFHFFGDANNPQKGPVGMPWIESFFNMTDTEPWYTEVMGAHSDNQCTPDQGGTDCYVRGAGPGTAWYAHDNLGMWGAFNDLRRAGAPLLKSWTTVALRVAPRVAQRLLSIREEFVGIFPNNSPEIMESRANYRVPIDNECFIWAYVPLKDWIPLNATFVEAWFHTHDVKDMWVFEAASITQVFADVAAAEQGHEKLACYGNSITETVENVMARQRQPDAAKLVCSFSQNVPRELVDLHEDGSFVQHLRQGRCTLAVDGPGFYVVSLHPKQAPNPLTPWRHDMWAHSLVRVYYTVPLHVRPRVSWNAAYFPNPPPAALVAAPPPSTPLDQRP